MSVQHTLERSIEVSGTGLHSGADTSVRLEPADPDTGLVFVSACGRHRVPARVDRVLDTLLATTLGHEGWRVMTVEHLLAALWGEGVDNAVVVVDGPEVPALDGSAAPWVEELQRAGLRAQDAPRRAIRVVEAVEVDDGERRGRVLPASRLEISVHIAFDHPLVGHQQVEMAIVNGTFSREIAWARTFGFVADIAAMQAMGLARGGGLHNALVYGSDGIVNPEGWRRHDEPVRHKVLDLLGDLALLGAPLLGRVEVDRPGHGFNRVLVRRLLDSPEAWQRADG